MNTPNPLIPQGSLPDSRGKSHVRIAVFTILAIHVVLLGALLMAGCKKTSNDQAANNPNPPLDNSSIPPLQDSNATPVAPAGNTPVTPPPGAPANSLAQNQVTPPPSTPTPPPACRPTRLLRRRFLLPFLRRWILPPRLPPLASTRS